VTVAHGIQEGSAGRAEQVAARRRGLGPGRVEVATVTVDGRGGPEAAARRARYAALDATADRLGAATILLGHTRDDQAETVLLGLARGSGGRSLAGMAPRSGRYRRPFLDLARWRCREACRAAGLEYWEDPHNADPAYARARVRHRVLPVLESELGPGIAAALARTAEQLRLDADALDAWAQQAYGRCEQEGALSVAELGGLPAAVRRRVLRHAALEAGAPATDLFAVHVNALDALVTDWHGQAWVDLPGGLRARRRQGWIRFERADMAR